MPFGAIPNCKTTLATSPATRSKTKAAPPPRARRRVIIAIAVSSGSLLDRSFHLEVGRYHRRLLFHGRLAYPLSVRNHHGSGLGLAGHLLDEVRNTDLLE